MLFEENLMSHQPAGLNRSKTAGLAQSKSTLKKTRIKCWTNPLTLNTHSAVVLVVLGYWHCYRRKTGSYEWSPEGSAFLGPDDSQQRSLHTSNII